MASRRSSGPVPAPDHANVQQGPAGPSDVPMIRLFAPPTRDGLVRANGITAASLVLHLAVGVALFVPLAQAVRADLIDRLVVFLIPPNQTGGREAGHGMLPVPAAFQAGPRATGLDQGGAASRIEAPGVAAAARVS